MFVDCVGFTGTFGTNLASSTLNYSSKLAVVFSTFLSVLENGMLYVRNQTRDGGPAAHSAYH